MSIVPQKPGHQTGMPGFVSPVGCPCVAARHLVDDESENVPGPIRSESDGGSRRKFGTTCVALRLAPAPERDRMVLPQSLRASRRLLPPAKRAKDLPLRLRAINISWEMKSSQKSGGPGRESE